MFREWIEMTSEMSNCPAVGITGKGYKVVLERQGRGDGKGSVGQGKGLDFIQQKIFKYT